jgi:hypothetical protein
MKTREGRESGSEMSDDDEMLVELCICKKMKKSSKEMKKDEVKNEKKMKKKKNKGVYERKKKEYMSEGSLRRTDGNA